MSQPKNAISCSPDEQRTEKRVIHRADNPCSPGESVRSNLIRPVNNKSLTNSPRELVTTIPARLVVRPVNTLKGLPGGARFLLSGFTAFRLLAPGSGSTSFQGLRPERRELHGAHPMRPLHPMHHVHHHRTRPRRDRTEKPPGLCANRHRQEATNYATESH